VIKIAFFDNDGTLLRFHHKELTDKTRYTLKKLQENGVLICMATGRGIMGVPHFKDVEFDAYITFNGSYVVDNKNNLIRSYPIPKEDVRNICNNLKEMKRDATLASKDFLVSSDKKDRDLAEYFAFSGETIKVVENFNEYVDLDVYQIMCACTKDEHQKIISGTKDAKVVSWWDRAADIIPLNSGKGKAVEAVLKYYGFKKEEAISFGDGENDIELFKACGTSIAMDNANEKTKANASFICKSVDEDGVYDYCLKHKLI